MTSFCPHVVGTFVRRIGFDGTPRMGQVVKRKPNLDGWVLSVRLADGTIEPWPCDGTVETAAAPSGALMLGMRGKPVTALQRRLESAGFPPGNIDGQFDVGTQSAVENFQHSRNFAATGIADAATLRQLGGKASNPTTWPQFTVAVVARMFSASTPLGAIKANLPLIAAAMEAAGLGSRRMALMALATIRAETESFEPISERVSRWNSSPNGHPFDLYDSRTDLGNRGRPDGETFKGRGFVQLTGRDNYSRLGEELGTDLVGGPELANQPDIAAKILAAFLARREQRIEQALLHDDLKLARRLVNGGSHGLDRFAEAYRTGEALVPV